MATQADLDPHMRGDTMTLNITVTGEDVTGDEFWFTMKSCLADVDASAALQFHETAPVGASATAGLHVLVVSSTLFAALTPGKFFYDVQWVDTSPTPNHVNTLTYGVVEILSDVSVDVV